MPPVKQYPKCCSMVPIKKSVCVCGHCFKKNLQVYSTTKSKRIAIAMQQQRASESADEIASRLVKDSTRKAQKRALETSDDTWYRLEQDRACKAKRRESETVVETALRQQHDRAYKAKKREAETVVETERRQQHDRACKAKKREAETCLTLTNFALLVERSVQ